MFEGSVQKPRSLKSHIHRQEGYCDNPETWIQDYVWDSELFGGGYTLYQNEI